MDPYQDQRHYKEVTVDKSTGVTDKTGGSRLSHATKRTKDRTIIKGINIHHFMLTLLILDQLNPCLSYFR